MKDTLVYTNTMKHDLMQNLKYYSEKNGIPKNKIIEKALEQYFEQLKKEEYIQSFKRAKMDKEQSELAETGFEEFIEATE